MVGFRKSGPLRPVSACRGPALSTSAIISPAFSSASGLIPDLLCFSHLRWHFVTQRPQHLLSRAARNRRVFFWEEPIWHEHAATVPLESEADGVSLEILQEAATLWVIRPHLIRGADAEKSQRTLLAQLMQRFSIRNFVRWYYTPMAMKFSGDLAALATVYDCMDELTGFLNAPTELAKFEQELFKGADVVFTGGVSLYEAKRHLHGNIHPFPSSIDVAHFAQARSLSSPLQDTSVNPEPTDQVTIPHPRAGFYGVIDERLDLALLQEVAHLRPEVNFVLLGPTAKIDAALLPVADNIFYLGLKTYEQLPLYLAGWDVALLPFALNEATRFISPTKTPEYLAAGKPVISTAIQDVVRDYGDKGLVTIARNATQFAAAIDRALEPQGSSWSEAVDRKLATSSWDSTWLSMDQQIAAACARKQDLMSVVAGLDLQKKKPRSQSYSSDRDASEARKSELKSFTSVTQGRKERFDYLVVGAGFAGSVLAERIASQLNKRVLLVDRRDHIAGNAYDMHDVSGLLIHKYGPHIFHTNSDKVVAYLSQFTDWLPYEHRVLASVNGQLLPIPINLTTINQLYSLNLDADGMRDFLATRTVTAPVIRTSEDVVLSRVGRDLYEKFFRNYTIKQWGLDPSQLDAAVAGRIPVRFDHDDRYFADTFQAMPRFGYTKMFERMLDHPSITVRTGVDFSEVADTYPEARIIYTGPIDEYFNFCFGPLPYRSLEFRHETHNRAVYQPAPVVNYPNDHEYTRITEFKYLTGQKHPKTSIVFEHPRSTGDPYYPIPRPENAALYEKYKSLAQMENNVHFCGRLANYKYLNMDQVVAQALTVFRSLPGSLAPQSMLLQEAKSSLPTSA